MTGPYQGRIRSRTRPRRSRTKPIVPGRSRPAPTRDESVRAPAVGAAARSGYG